jgi:hypothetical protein
MTLRQLMQPRVQNSTITTLPRRSLAAKGGLLIHTLLVISGAVCFGLGMGILAGMVGGLASGAGAGANAAPHAASAIATTASQTNLIVMLPLCGRHLSKPLRKSYKIPQNRCNSL